MFSRMVAIVVLVFMTACPMSSVLAEDVFITRTGKFYYPASSPFIKARAMVKISRDDAQARGYKPSKSYLKAKEKESRAPAAYLQQQY